MAEKECDHKSVGMLAWNGDKLLILQRKKFPYGYAAPAGHLDGDSYPVACIKEFREETGLKVVGAPRPVVLPGGSYRVTRCRREDGAYHYWQLFEVAWEGELKKNPDEVLGIGWLDIESIKILGEKTERFLRGEIQDDDWFVDPGLEPIWHEFFKELKII
jgi:8-oxo-dGTP pyrophosphatase MutT (NUDIX family)